MLLANHLNNDWQVQSFPCPVGREYRRFLFHRERQACAVRQRKSTDTGDLPEFSRNQGVPHAEWLNPDSQLGQILVKARRIGPKLLGFLYYLTKIDTGNERPVKTIPHSRAARFIVQICQ